MLYTRYKLMFQVSQGISNAPRYLYQLHTTLLFVDISRHVSGLIADFIKYKHVLINTVQPLSQD